MTSARLTKRTSIHRWLPLLLTMFAIVACEHIDMEDIEGSTNKKEESADIIAPLRTGEGTIDAPYTVADIQQLGDSLYETDVWVIGYAVGTARQALKNAVFTSPFENESNILLADTKQCESANICLPVNLKTDALKNALSLKKNASMHRQCLILNGTVDKYLSTTGIRTINQYRWLEDFSIPSSLPSEWEIDSIR